MDTSKDKIRYILRFFFYKGESKAAENVNSVYGPDTVTVNHAQFRFHSGNFDAKDASRSGRPIVENVDKIMGIVESDLLRVLKIAQKTIWNDLNKTGYEK